MADNETVFTFKANTKPAEDSVEEFGDKVVGIGKKVGAAFAAYFTFSAIKSGLEKSISAAVDADKAVKELNNSLGITGQYTDQASKNFQDYASKLQSATGISDEVIMRGAASLVQLGRVSTENLNKVTKASLDLAAGMGVDTATAFDIMTKAANGNVMALSRYGIKANEAKSDSEKFASVLGQIQSRFGGLAEANADPFKKFMVSVDEAFESIGKFFTHSKVLKAAFIVISDEITKFMSSIEKIGSGVALVDKITLGFFEMGKVISTYVVAPVEFLLNMMRTGFLTIFSGIAFGAEKIVSIFDSSLAEKIKVIREGLMQDLVSSTDQGFATPVADSVGAKLDEIKQKVIDTAAVIRTEIPTATMIAAEQTKSDWDSLVQGFSGGFQTMKSFTEDFKKNLVSLGATLRGTVANGFTNAFASIGKALVTGEDAFGSFGKAILQMLGQVAMQMGQFYIAAGIAAMFLNPGQGAGLIAGGAALSVLGGVLMALGSGSSGAGATGAAGSSTTNPAYTQEVGGSFVSDQERAKPQTGITVNVQGHILDRRESGLALAEIINEAFDTNGTVIRATS